VVDNLATDMLKRLHHMVQITICNTLTEDRQYKK